MKTSAMVLLFVFGISLSLPALAETDAAVLRRLDELSAGQKQILEELEQIKAQLQVIQVRVTK